MGDENEFSTIAVDLEVKKKLDEIKIHPRETYNDTLRRILINGHKKVKA